MIAQLDRKNYRPALIAVILFVVSGCASSGGSYETVEPRAEQKRAPTTSRPSRARHSFGERAAIVALDQVGVPYRYGGSNQNGFDCSGLVQFSYAKAGLAVPRTTGQLWSSTSPVARRDLEVGDLLFFSFAGKMSHVGLYIGGDEFVHAPSSGKTVSVASLTSQYYSRALLRAGRPR